MFGARLTVFSGEARAQARRAIQLLAASAALVACSSTTHTSAVADGASDHKNQNDVADSTSDQLPATADASWLDADATPGADTATEDVLIGDKDAALADRVPADGLATDRVGADDSLPDTAPASADTADGARSDAATADGNPMLPDLADGATADASTTDLARADGSTTDGASSNSTSGLCSSDGWCWVSPVPQGNNLAAAWASGPSDVWIGGAGGTLLHWNGMRLEPYELTSWHINALWGTSPNFVIASASEWRVSPQPDDLLFRWDGSKWAQWMTSPIQSALGIWGTSETDVWLVGTGAAHWDGSKWTLAGGLGNASLVTGSAKDDLWAAATYLVDGDLWHCDGTTWTDIVAPSGVGSVASAGRGKAWICSLANFPTTVPMLWDGKSWSTPNPEMTDCWTLWSPTAGDLWAAGTGLHHYVAGGWQDVYSGAARVSVFAGTSSDDFWGAGFGGSLVHAQHGVIAAVGSARPSVDYRGVWPVGPDDIWVASPGSSSVQHWQGGVAVDGWAAADARAINDLMARSPNDIWVVGNRGLAAHYDGSSWKEIDADATTDLMRVWANAANDVWAVGRTTETAWFDGTHWTVDKNMTGAGCTSLWGNGSDLLAICQNGGVLAALRRFPAGMGMLGMWVARTSLDAGVWGKGLALWGTKDSHIIVAGSDGTTGKGFLGTYTGTLNPLDDMGTFQIATEFDDTPNTLWAGSADDVWVAGLGIYHWDGSASTPARSSLHLDNYIYGLAADSGGALWAVGENATILRHAPAK
jgi:hypothetical protein